MDFVDELEKAIGDEAKKLELRYHAYHNALHLERLRRSKQVKSLAPKEIRTPVEWLKDRKYNPFYVHKHRASIARSIAKKILNGTYVPMEPVRRSIPKASGGVRQICVFQIPDAAVSNLFYKRLMDKNRHRFSGYSYAYRDDRNAHFAIQDIAVDLRQHARVYIAEYDFSKFFDSIDHSYLEAQFSENGFSISDRERLIIKRFLLDGGKGIPQGTSISLFLANLACWRMDKALDSAGLRFARYADDTVIWSPDHGRISHAVQLVSDFSIASKIGINLEKSKGVRLLCPPEMPSEFSARTNQFEFLGYRISNSNIGIKDKAVLKIKRQINYLLYRNLLQPLRGWTNLEIPSGGEDRDLSVAIGSIRRYLYGNLSDDYIRRYLAGGSGRLFFKGVMSFYPLLSDTNQMRALDGWMINQLWKTLRLRQKLLSSRFSVSNRFPFNISRSDLAEVLRGKKTKGRRLYSAPSFVLIHLALTKAVSEQGLLSLLVRDDYSNID